MIMATIEHGVRINNRSGEKLSYMDKKTFHVLGGSLHIRICDTDLMESYLHHLICQTDQCQFCGNSECEVNI